MPYSTSPPNQHGARGARVRVGSIEEALALVRRGIDREDVTARGLASVYAQSLGAVASQQLKVSIAGSGGVRAQSSGTADVSIMGSGDVEIGGGAKCHVSKMGSGNVRCS